jgi:hypothetical protein
MSGASTNGESTESTEVAERPLETLLRIASSARLHRSVDGLLHARVPVGDRFEVFGLKSAAFRDWLVDRYFAARREPVSQWAIHRVVGVLEARARFDEGTPSVFIRVGRDREGTDPAYFLDLGDPTGRAIRVCAEGWAAVDRPDVHFRRPEGLLPLPIPSQDGSIELLRPYVNLTDADFQLLSAWLTAALRPVGPYPILVLYGEQGSAKSTLAKILRLLIDPQACPLLAEPRSTRDLIVTAMNGWLLAYDNISAIPGWLSDSLCRLAYGAGFAGRTRFSNDERSVIYAQRPVILNGIEEFVRRGDLVDRCIFLHLPPIPADTRRAEAEFWSSFQADYPRILGGVMSAVVGGLRELPSIKLPELPRMADYAEWGAAVSQALGWPPGDFIWNYNANRQEASVLTLEDSAVAIVMFELAPLLDEWSGPPASLHAELTDYIESRAAELARESPSTAKLWKAATSARWPRTPREFSNELRRIVGQLRLNGLSVEFKRHHKGRRIAITCPKSHWSKNRTTAAASSPSTAGESHAGRSG